MNIKLPPNCFAFLNAELLSASNGAASVRFTPTEEMENPYGNIQGGILAGMIDNVLGPAVVSLAPEKPTATIHMSVNFLGSVRANEPVIGTARVVRYGRTQIYLEAEMTRESDGKLVLKATATNVLLDKK
ncbi:MAG TPA: PaaI family thioesterase [Spirochaetota bacterium]|nr:PaaI family thioesterase [Spirochaetota bacterium]